MGRRYLTPRTIVVAAALSVTGTTVQAASFVLNNQGGVEVGTAAERGFRAAANFWTSRMSNSFTLQLDVGFGALGPNVLASAGSARDLLLVQDMYAALGANAASSLDAMALANLQPLGASQIPGVGGIAMVTPGYTGTDINGVGFGIDNSTFVFDNDGSVNNVLMAGNTANLKALGLITDQSVVDADITFSSEFAFDFNPTDGISAGQIDFIGVAIHEIGHALGFVSGVDDYDVLGLPNGPFRSFDCQPGPGMTLCEDYPVNEDYWGMTADLFRYGDVGNGPDLVWKPGTDAFFSVDGGVTRIGNLSTGDYNGDGWQASHWKRKLPGQDPIGVMDPAVSFGQLSRITGADFAFFDAIGYNFNFNYGAGTPFSPIDAFNAVPEPSTWALLIAGFGLAGGVLRRRRRFAA